MKNIHRLGVLVTALMGGFTSLMAADPVASATVDVELVAPLSLSKSADMQFGRVSLNGNGEGVLILGVDGTVQASNLVASQSGGATPSAAVFSIDGLDGTNYTVSLPTSSVTLTKVGSTETLTASNFTVKLASKGVGVTTGTLGTDDSFAVGATLTIPQTQTEGKYQGSFSVSVSYN